MNPEKEELKTGSDVIEIWDTFSRVFRKSRRKIILELDDLGIKTAELKVLYHLSHDGMKSMNFLATKSEVSGPWITGIVDELERKGLVAKVRSATDRRIIKVTITDNGDELLSKGIEAYKALIELALRGLSQAESREFLNLLKKMDKTIED